MNSVRLLWPLIRRYKAAAILNILFNLLAAFFSVFSLLMLIPFLQVLFYDEQQLVRQATVSDIPFAEGLYHEWLLLVKTEGQKTALVVLCLGLVGAFLLKNGFRFLALNAMIPMRTGVMRDLRKKIYEKLLVLDFPFFQSTRRGDILTRFGQDVQEVEYGIINFIETGLKEPVTIIITLISLVWMSPVLTLWVFILLPVSGYVIGRIGKRLKRDSLKAQYQLSLLQMMVDELMHGIRIIQSLGNVSVVSSKFEKINNEYRELHTAMLRRKELASPLSEVLGITVVAILLLIGGSAILSGESSLSPEVFITYIVVFSQIIAPAKAFANAWYFIQKGIASLQRINELLNTSSFLDRQAGKQLKASFESSIVIRDLSYSFGEKSVLDKIDLEIRKAEKVAIIGPSGSGKTTLIQLLCRFYDVPSGKIFIDGADIEEISLEDYRKLYAIVTQEPILFFGTVEDNLRMAKPDATLDEIIASLEKADALRFVRELPEGIQTVIGERGARLSGGQQQRIALARAYLKNAPVLILDEATAALDSNADNVIREAIVKLSEGKTVIAIAHRLTTVQGYDRIIVLEEGRITGNGSHASLLKTHPLYHQLVQNQLL